MGVISEIAAGNLLNHENDLPGMLGEVFDHVVDGLEHGDVVFLDLDGFGEAGGIEAIDDGDGFGDDGGELRGEFGCGRTGASGEFGIASAKVGLAADAGEDPLSNVAAEMEDEVAGRVFVLAAAGPDLVVGEAAEAIVDARGELLELARRAIREEAIDGRVHFLSIEGGGNFWPLMDADGRG